jgi:excisionase family DNA binding protein
MITLPRKNAPVPVRPTVAAPLDLLTVRQAAGIAQVSEPTIRRWIRDEGLRSYSPKKGGRVRIDKSDLVYFLKGEAD